MTLQQLHYFRVLAKVQHYTKAADILHIAQPSLSYSISQLESELSIKLFEKQGKQVRLSYPGEKFLEYVEKSLEILEDGTMMLKTLSDTEKGEVTLGYIYSISSKFIPEMIKKFYEKDSNKHIKFSFVQNLSEMVLKDLKNNKIDLAFCPKPDKSFQCIPIFKQKLYLIAPKNHPFSSRGSIKIAEIIDEPFVAISKSSSLRDTVNDIYRQLNASPKVVFEAEECNAAISFVSLNFGISIIPEIPSMTKDVTVIEVEDFELEREIYLCWTEKYLSPTVSKAKDFIIDNFTQNE